MKCLVFGVGLAIMVLIVLAVAALLLAARAVRRSGAV
jgi:hypothetical protein